MLIGEQAFDAIYEMIVQSLVKKKQWNVRTKNQASLIFILSIDRNREEV